MGFVSCTQADEIQTFIEEEEREAGLITTPVIQTRDVYLPTYLRIISDNDYQKNHVSHFIKDGFFTVSPPFIERIQLKQGYDKFIRLRVLEQPETEIVCNAIDLCAPIRFAFAHNIEDDENTNILITRIAPFTKADGTLNDSSKMKVAMHDFTPQTIKIEVTDTKLKKSSVQEITIHPPKHTPDCDAFPDNNAERFECLFTQEILPTTPPPTTQAQRYALPSHLEYPKDDYSLVFAEEFNGEGMQSLDTKTWTYSSTPTRDVNGKPCEYIRDGHYWYTSTTLCTGRISTGGKVEYKYGYIEIDVSHPLGRHRGQTNIAAVLWSFDRGNNLRKYGIELDTLEKLTRYAGGYEVDIYEYLPNFRTFAQGFYSLYRPDTRRHVRGLIPAYAETSNLCFCPFATVPGRPYSGRCVGRAHTYAPSVCNLDENDPNKVLRITQGIEWTPHGFVRYIKKHGIDDDFVPLPYDAITPWTISSVWQDKANKMVKYEASHRVSKSDKNNYETIRDADGNIVKIVQKFAMSHVPMFMKFDAWGNTSRDFITTGSRVNYVRVYKPKNNYADITPRYQ